MRVRTTIIKLPLRLGFDGVDRDGPIAADGYPPYNLERLPRAADGMERLRLVFAVAGFAPDQLDVSVTDRHLVVRGEQTFETEERQFIYRGIAARRFQKSFRLADGLDVVQADLADGLLTIDMTRRHDCSSTKSIRIAARDA